jgi:hypothetical protein
MGAYQIHPGGVVRGGAECLIAGFVIAWVNANEHHQQGAHANVRPGHGAGRSECGLEV